MARPLLLSSRLTMVDGRAFWVKSHVLRWMIQLASARGLNPRSLWGAVDIDPRLAETTGAHIETQKMFALVERVVSLTGDRALLPRVVDDMPLRTLGVLGYAMRCAPDVSESVERFERYLSAFAGGVEVTCWQRSEGKLVITFRRLETKDCLGRRMALESHVLTLVSHERRLTGTRWVPLAVSFPHPLPPHVHEVYAAYLGCEVQQADGCATIVLDRPTAQLEHASADAEMLSFFDEYIQRLRTEDPAEGSSLSQRTRTLLRRRLSHGAPRAGEVARALGMSRRSFYRQLEEENTSFGAILDALRYDLSAALLRLEGLSVDEVAAALGFSGARAFCRAFKRWTGSTPGVFRAEFASERSARRTRS